MLDAESAAKDLISKLKSFICEKDLPDSYYCVFAFTGMFEYRVDRSRGKNYPYMSTINAESDFICFSQIDGFGYEKHSLMLRLTPSDEKKKSVIAFENSIFEMSDSSMMYRTSEGTYRTMMRLDYDLATAKKALGIIAGSDDSPIIGFSKHGNGITGYNSTVKIFAYSQTEKHLKDDSRFTYPEFPMNYEYASYISFGRIITEAPRITLCNKAGGKYSSIYYFSTAMPALMFFPENKDSIETSSCRFAYFENPNVDFSGEMMFWIVPRVIGLTDDDAQIGMGMSSEIMQSHYIAISAKDQRSIDGIIGMKRFFDTKDDGTSKLTLAFLNHDVMIM